MIFVFAAAIALTSCGSNENKEAEIERANRTTDSLQMEMVKQHTIDSMNAVAAQQQAVNNEPSAKVATAPHHTGSVVHNHYTTNTTNNTYASTANEPVSTTTTEQKKGWSAKAKGAVIGAGAGAIGGALIDSKHKGDAVKGGVIGGVLGAAAGLGAGAIIDHKNKQKDAPDQNK